jgi:hypothetical protein
MIKDAHKEIFIRSFDPETFARLNDELKEAKGRNVRLKSIVLAQEESLLRGIKDMTQLVDFRKVGPTTTDRLGIFSSISQFLSRDMPSDFSEISVIISDMRQSIFTVGDAIGENRFAVWFGIPMIAAIQRAIFEYMWQSSERIG